MPRSLPDERLTPTFSAAITSRLPFKGGVGVGAIAAAIASDGDAVKVVTRFARPTPNPSLEGRG